jgi:hypothetical protein
MVDPGNEPFFIVGSPRSGTTLLRFLLCSHPRIFIPDETGFIPFLLKSRAIDEKLTLRRFEGLIERMGRLNYQWKGIVNDSATLYRSLPSPTLGSLLDAVFRKTAKDHNASRWGDKTPLYVRYIPLLKTLFPRARFIHMIRDGRDATISAQDKWGISEKPYMDNFYLLKNWVDNVSIGRQAGSVLGADDYLEVRYEELVANVETSVKAVCDFLGEAYSPEMLDQTRVAKELGPGPDDHWEAMERITSKSVERWRKEMSEFDLKLANRIAGGLLRELGYGAPIELPFSGREEARFRILSGKYQITSTVRKWLYATGLVSLNRKMRRRI